MASSTSIFAVLCSLFLRRCLSLLSKESLLLWLVTPPSGCASHTLPTSLFGSPPLEQVQTSISLFFPWGLYPSLYLELLFPCRVLQLNPQHFVEWMSFWASGYFTLWFPTSCHMGRYPMHPHVWVEIPFHVRSKLTTHFLFYALRQLCSSACVLISLCGVSVCQGWKPRCRLGSSVSSFIGSFRLTESASDT